MDKRFYIEVKCPLCDRVMRTEVDEHIECAGCGTDLQPIAGVAVKDGKRYKLRQLDVDKATKAYNDMLAHWEALGVKRSGK